MPFTQQQLEDAYAQMAADREAERATANQAADWLRQQIVAFAKPGNVHTVPITKARFVSPHSTQYVMRFVYETYGPYRNQFVQFLATVPWAQPTNSIPGFPVSEPFYTVTTPHGVYPLTFDYFDNHCTGY